MIRPLFALALWLAAVPAHAALTAAELAKVKVAPPPGATAPLDLPLRGTDGRPITLRSVAQGEPLVLVFADYGCTTLCGPALAIAAQRLAESGLKPGGDYRLAVVGLDPNSAPAQAAAFGAARLPPTLLRATTLLTGAAPAINRETAALGYGYAYDAEARNFAHPVSVFVLKPDGRLSSVLSEVAITAPALRDTVHAAAADPPPASFVDRVALVCHGALAALGRFDAPAILALRAGGLLTLALGGLALFLMRRRRVAA